MEDPKNELENLRPGAGNRAYPEPLQVQPLPPAAGGFPKNSTEPRAIKTDSGIDDPVKGSRQKLLRISAFLILEAWVWIDHLNTGF